MGVQSGGSKAWTGVNPGRTPLRTSRDFENEEPHLQLCVVAKIRRRHLRESQIVTSLLVASKGACSSPFTSLGVAEQPWCRVHADYTGSFQGKMFLLLVDAHSKWLEVHMMESSTSATIEKMKACHGLAILLVTKNGSYFTNQEFEDFLKRHGVRHVRMALYHPSSNGLVERAMQTFKTAIKKSGGKESPWKRG